MKLKRGQKPQDIVAMDDHPLLTEECCIPTYGLEVFYNAAISLLRGRRPGMVIKGNPRSGKTFSIESFQENHSSLLGREIPVFHMQSWTVGPKTVSTEARFFGSLLKAMGYELAFSGTAALRLDRAVEFILERVESAGDNRAMLVVDEGQNLGRREYGYLMDIYNQVRGRGCRFKVMIVGQEKEMNQQIGKMQKYPQIRERFHTVIKQFPGLRTESDIRRILECIDNTSSYPEGSGWTYTYFFLPDAYTAGFRLSDSSQIIWTALKSAFLRYGEVTVQAAIEVITDLLVELSYSDEKSLVLEEGLVNAIIKDLRFSASSDMEASNDSEFDQAGEVTD